MVDALAVGGLRALERFVAIDVDERVQPAVERVDPRQAGFDDVARAGLAAREKIGKLGQRAQRQVGGHAAKLPRRSGNVD